MAIALWKLDFKTPRNLYEYLLIDGEMSGCSEISYIKEALNATQLYLQRCRLGLEPGATTNNIPPIWWEWMMNYRIWEANRKVFLYPENYLDPGLRSSKTTLFKNLESQLLQADITPASVEDAYRQYIEGFSELAKLKYVDAYSCKVNDSLRGEIDVLFLFARTQTEPYSYYYCTREEGVTWTEWQKIDITIGSAYITPVYAFSKLFIFWVELKEKTDSSLTSSKDSGTQSNKNKFYNATVKYSFYDLSKKWIQPQTLYQDVVVYSLQDDYIQEIKAANTFEDLFEMDDLYWHKVYAFSVCPENYWQKSKDINKAEKITIIYGPFLGADDSKNQLDLSQGKPPNDKQNPDQSAFKENIYTGADNFNRVVNVKANGYIPLNLTVTMNTTMQEDFLLIDREFLLLETTQSEATLPTFKPQIDSLNTTLNIIDSNNVVHDNYFGDYTPEISDAKFPSPANQKSFMTEGISEVGSLSVYNDLKGNYIIDQSDVIEAYFSTSTDLSFLFAGASDQEKADLIPKVRKILFSLMGSPILFSKVAQRNVKVINVKNQPGWFIFDNGDEAFLITPEKVNFQTIADALTVRSIPLLNQNSFSNATGIGTLSPQVYSDLRGNNIIDQYGRLDKYFSADTDLSFLFAGAPDEEKNQLIREVQNILLNLPTIQVTDLITDKIKTKGLAQQVYNDLKGNNIIDRNGRLDRYFSAKTDLSFLFAGASQEDKTYLIKKVKDILLNLPVVTPLGYFGNVAKAEVSNIQDYKFGVTRISTGAIYQLSQDLFTGGIDRLLSLQTQQIPVKPKMPFDRLVPGVKVIPPNAADGTPTLDGTQVDFEGSYGIYFWEIFFHTPLLIGTRLAANQKFDAAQKWLQYIFNPTASENFIHNDTFNQETSNDINQDDSRTIYNELLAHTLDGTINTAKILDENGRVNPNFSYQTNLSFLLGGKLSAKQTSEVRNILLNYKIATSKSYYWQFQPFRNQSLQSLKDMLSEKDGAGNENQALKYWNNHPFDPHAIAGLRMGAYEKAMVMQYIDLLLDWGDYMFAQDNWESITQATLLYVYAYDLLGPRPKSVGKCKSSAPATFENIREKYKSGDIPQFLIELENLVPHTPSSTPQVNLAKIGQPFNDLDVYFCVPENEQFISYWDRVEDRLFKIRHCMNIQGVERQLDLFQPPLDVMQLVRAAASGNNILNALTHGGQDIPHYRFQYMIDRAKNITSTVIQLGASLLSALEKKDAEQIGILRSTQEENILNLMLLLKKKQIEEASETLDSLNKTLDGAKNRSQHYQKLIDGGLSVHEQDSQNLMISALAFETAASIANFISSPVYGVPTIFGLADGGFAPGDIIRAIGEGTRGTAAVLNQGASLAAIMGEHDRRREEWEFQKLVADDDITQIEKQIAASQVRLDIANQELTVHQKSIEQAKEIETFLKSKFSNQDLYQWMADRIATVYFQSYKIALDMALATQSTYQYELNSDDAFITMQYWDSLRKGLLAGEGLMFALTQLEKAYLDNSSRHLEIEKTISLLQLNPQAFLDLKATGKCTFSLDEILFDYDFPGHYCRKIKSVSLSIPAIVGPYQNIKATLSQTYNAVVYQADSAAKAVDFLLNGGTGERPSGLRENWRPNQQIAISKGVDDSGMFVLNFNDERYLPFEGTGAVSKWELKMPKETNRIDFEQLSDVIIDLKYTALYDGGLEKAVIGKLAQKPYPAAIYLNLKQAFASAWYNFMSAKDDKAHQKLTFQIATNMLLPNLKSVTLDSVFLKLDVSKEVIIQDKSEFVTLNIASSFSQSISLTQNLWTAKVNLPQEQFWGDEISWTIDVDLAKVRQIVDQQAGQDSGKLLKDGFLDPDHFQNVEIVLAYTAQIFTQSQTN